MSEKTQKPTKADKHALKLRIAAALERVEKLYEQMLNRPVICDGCAKRMKQ